MNDKISVMDEAVKIARTQDDIVNSRLELKKSLEDLSAYTMRKYKLDKLEILDFDEMNIQSEIVPIKYFEPMNAKISAQESDLSFNSAASLEAKFYDFEIEKKKAELSMYKRPKTSIVKFYTNYSLLGKIH